MIKIKSTSDSISKRDGIRIFVTRYWPRGCSRSECDEWIPALAPSEKLLHEFRRGQISWEAFSKLYQKEIQKGYSNEDGINSRMKNSGQRYFLRFLRCIAEDRSITLICSCSSESNHCHRALLKKLIETA